MRQLIIPPILDKTNNYNHILLRSLWKKAFKAIQKAKNIYIYGFSFPITDLSVKVLFKINKTIKYMLSILSTILVIKRKDIKKFLEKEKCDFSFCCDDNLEKLAKHLNKKC